MAGAAGQPADGERVRGERAFRAADQRVHVERLELVTELAGELRQAGDRPDDRAQISRGGAPGPVQQPADAQLAE